MTNTGSTLDITINDAKTALVGDRLVRAGDNGIHDTIKTEAIATAAERSAVLTVTVTNTDTGNTTYLRVTPEGQVSKASGPAAAPSQEVTAPQPVQPSPVVSSAPSPAPAAAPPISPVPPPHTPRPAPSAPHWNQASPAPAPQVPHAEPNPYLHAPAAPAAGSWVSAPVKSVPESGWRRLAYVLSGGAWNPGENPVDVKRRDLDQIIRTPIAERGYTVAMLMAKGGAGKTTTTVGLANALAETRMDSVLGIDTNPHAGNLAERGGNDHPSRLSITDLLAKKRPDGSSAIEGITDVRYFTAGSTQRADFLASDHTPGVKLTREEYDEALAIVRKHYGIVLTDCGTGLEDNPVMPGVLDQAKTLVIPTSPKDDGGRIADLTLDWIEHQGWGHLLARTVVVVSIADAGKTLVDVDAMVKHFESRAQHVHVIPYDRHLAEGGLIHTDRLGKDTYDAYRDLAALIAPDFAAPTGSHAAGYQRAS